MIPNCNMYFLTFSSGVFLQKNVKIGLDNEKKVLWKQNQYQLLNT